jgi:iron-sulfur cluster repair protein YtfE (RIC family)
MKTVDEVIASWTPEEREQFKDLIDECKKRERMIADNRDKSLKGIKAIVDNMIGGLYEKEYKGETWPKA